MLTVILTPNTWLSKFKSNLIKQVISQTSFDKVTEEGKLARFAKIKIYAERNLYRAFFKQSHLHPLIFFIYQETSL